MSQIRITKTTELDQILLFLKSKWPLMDEVEIVKMAISKFFQDEKKQSNFQTWLNSLPELDLSDKQKQKLQDSLGKSIKSGFVPWNSDDFTKEMME